MRFFIFLVVLFSSLYAKNVLLLNSYRESFNWTKVQDEAIEKELNRYKSDDLLYYIEFMDTKVFRLTRQREQNLLNYYAHKYKNIKFDAIITTDDNALNFVRKYKNNPLFKDAKVFFSGINNLSLQNVLDKNIYAGVFEVKDPLANLKLAKEINKDLKTIYLVADDTPTGDKEIVLYKKKLQTHKEIKYIYLNEQNIDKIVASLKNYDKNSVMMLLTFSGFTQKNEHISVNKAVQLLSKIYKNPMLIHTNIFAAIPKTNIVGGNCTDAKMQGRIAAKKALQYLIDDVKVRDIGLQTKNANKFYLNEKNLEKFGLHVSDFDVKNPVVVNKEDSFYKRYALWINIVLVFIVFIIVVIIVFIVLLKIKVQQQLKEIQKKDEMLQQQSKLASMGEMIGAIAHQWRQPLNQITISIQNLKYDFNNGEIDEVYIKKFIDENKKVIKFMSKTIDNFRNFFRVDKEKKEFKIKEMIEDVASLLSAQLKSYHITLTIRGDEFVYYGLHNELQQVVLNILNNAKDVLMEKEVKNPTIAIEIKKGIITVCDNGGGIPKEIINRIFEPYFTTKEQGRGTGMGLYMSKMIIEENMGGKLSVTNSDDGACFKIVLQGNK